MIRFLRTKSPWSAKSLMVLSLVSVLVLSCCGKPAKLKRDPAAMLADSSLVMTLAVDNHNPTSITYNTKSKVLFYNDIRNIWEYLETEAMFGQSQAEFQAGNLYFSGEKNDYLLNTELHAFPRQRPANSLSQVITLPQNGNDAPPSEQKALSYFNIGVLPEATSYTTAISTTTVGSPHASTITFPHRTTENVACDDSVYSVGNPSNELVNTAEPLDDPEHDVIEIYRTYPAIQQALISYKPSRPYTSLGAVLACQDQTIVALIETFTPEKRVQGAYQPDGSMLLFFDIHRRTAREVPLRGTPETRLENIPEGYSIFKGFAGQKLGQIIGNELWWVAANNNVLSTSLGTGKTRQRFALDGPGETADDIEFTETKLSRYDSSSNLFQQYEIPSGKLTTDKHLPPLDSLISNGQFLSGFTTTNLISEN